MQRFPIHGAYNHFARHVEPRGFRRVVKHQVKGGRWSVRKYNVRLDIFQVARGETIKPWRAWSIGQARGFSRWFETQQEAVAWARDIAWTYRMQDGAAERALMRQNLALNGGRYRSSFGGPSE